MSQSRIVGRLLPVDELQYALAAEIHGEMKAQRMTAIEIQRRTGIKQASWTNWFVTVKRPVAVSTVVLVAEALGLSTSELLRRAEVRVAQSPRVDPIEAELLEGMSPRAREAHLRNRSKDEPADPPEPATEGNRQAS